MARSSAGDYGRDPGRSIGCVSVICHGITVVLQRWWRQLSHNLGILCNGTGVPRAPRVPSFETLQRVANPNTGF